MQKLIVALIFGALCFAYTSALHAAVEGDNYYCIILDADNITGTITTQSHETNATAPLDFSIGELTNIEGKCYHALPGNKTAENIVLSWSPQEKALSQPWTLEITFTSAHDNNKNFKLENISLTAVLPPTTKTYMSTYHLLPTNQTFSASDANGYTCATSKFDLDRDSSITFTNIRIVAFAHSKSANFSTDQVFEQCSADSVTSAIVPIIVGACLAGLVIVVLIAYLIGRARSRRQGYASV